LKLKKIQLNRQDAKYAERKQIFRVKPPFYHLNFLGILCVCAKPPLGWRFIPF
jgi:hypothetical protein